MSLIPDWWDSVKRVMSNNGVPVEIWLPILWAESTGNPYAHNTRPPDDSVGLFQLNRRGGQGAGYTVDQLKNPVINAEIASRPIAQAMAVCARQGQAGNIVCIAINSGHPGPVPTSDPRVQTINRYASMIRGAGRDETKLQALTSATGGTGSGGTPPGGGGDGGDGGDGGPPGGGSWTINLGLPEWLSMSPGEISAGFVRGAIRSLMGPFGSMLPADSEDDVWWAFALGIGGLALVGVGVIGLAVNSGVPQTIVGNTPQGRALRGAARGIDAAGSVLSDFQAGQAAAYIGEAAEVV